MSRIEVVKGEKEGKFRVLVNFVQEGCEVSNPDLANNQAVALKSRYPSYTVHPFVVKEPTEPTKK